jgi:hypothetical protein
LWQRLVAAGTRRHLRGFFYMLVSQPDRVLDVAGEPFINDHKHWVALQAASNAARWLGSVPFGAVIDERNAQSEVHVPVPETVTTDISPGMAAEVPENVEEALPAFELKGFQGRQTHRIIFYGEKSSLADILRPIAVQIGAEMIIVVGESSTTRIAEAAERLGEDGRPGVILYFSDFDPSGYQMPISVARKLQALRDLCHPTLDIKLYPVALTFEQVRELGLPSSPLKDEEKRSTKWRAAFDGHEQTEIDALVELRPDVLRRVTYDALAPFYDFSLPERTDKAAEEWQSAADEALAAHPDYQRAVTQIAAAWEEARDSVERLVEEQTAAADALREAMPAVPALPEAQPTRDAGEPLFDSADDFITATQRLIRHKKLFESAVDDNAEDAETEEE